MTTNLQNFIKFKFYSFILQKKNFTIMLVSLLIVSLFWMLQLFTPWLSPWNDQNNLTDNLTSLTGPFINLICSTFFLVGLYILLLSLFKIRIWNQNNKNLILLSNNISKKNILYSEMLISIILFFLFLFIFVFFVPALMMAKWVGEKNNTINLYFSTKYLYIYLGITLLFSFGCFFTMSSILNVIVKYNTFKIILFSVPLILYFSITILNGVDSGKFSLFNIGRDSMNNFEIKNWTNTYVYLGITGSLFIISLPFFIITNNNYTKKIDWI